MNITLVNTNAIRPPLSPAGLLYLAGYLRKKGHRVELIDPYLDDDRTPGERLIERIKAGQRPDLIGFSIRNIDSAQMQQSAYYLPEAAALVRCVRSAFPGVALILGGAGFSIEPEEIMTLTGADYGIVGEGERALEELLRALELGGGFSGIAGLVRRREDGELILNPARNASEAFLKRLPFQALDMVDYARYYKMGGSASVQTKRGCALQCSYCTYPLIEGKSYRLIDPVRVVDEMEYLAAQGFDYFHFSDSVFNVPKEHAVAVCEELLRRKSGVRWHAYTSPFKFDDELASLMVRAGSDGVYFGIDSCSDTVLAAYGKNYRQKDIYAAARACRRADMEFSFHILVGPPSETEETLEETLGVIDDIRPTAVFIAEGIRVYRGTPVHARLVREGRLKAAASMLNPYFYYSESLPSDSTRRILDFARARDFVYCTAAGKSPQVNHGIVELYKSGFRGPLWRILSEMKKGARRKVLAGAAESS